MKMTIFSAGCIGNKANCLYPNRHEVADAAAFAKAVAMDHVCATYRDNYRSAETFLSSDVLMMDIDNDHSENPADWITPEALDNLMPDVEYVMVPSRHHQLWKDQHSPRPRYHVYFPIAECFSAKVYAAIKKALYEAMPFFDDNALDAARFSFGCTNEDIEWHEGWISITEYLGDDVTATSETALSRLSRDVIPAGSRNSTMSHFAGRVLKRYGITEQAHSIFLEESKKCDPPMDPEELDTIWGSACKFAKRIQSEEGYVAPEDYNSDFGSRSLKPEDYSDIGQAKVLAREYGNELCYTDGTDYLRYNGERWDESRQQAIGAMEDFLDMQLEDALEEVAASLQAATSIGIDEADLSGNNRKFVANLDGKQLKAYFRYMAAVAYKAFVLKRRDMKYVLSALQAAKPMLEIKVSDLDKDEFLLNVPGATYDLKLGLDGGREPSATDFITKQTAVAPGNDGEQIWRDALNTFFCGDADLIRYVQQIVGLAAIGKVYVEAMIIAYGDGRNGKSTFWNTVSRVLGSYSGAISADALTVGCKRNVKPEMAELKGKRLIIAAELEEGMRLSTSIVKQLTSTDEIQAEKKYKDPFKFTPGHTLVLYTNHLPKVGANDEGIWRRLIVIPFHARIEGSSDKKNYADYLFEAAGPAIMSWIIEGAKAAIDNDYHFVLPHCVDEAIKAYRNNNDWLGNFMSECCDTGKTLVQKSGELYQAYRNYCAQNGEYTRSTTDFYTALENAGFARKKTMKGTFVYGLQLREDEDFLN